MNYLRDRVTAVVGFGRCGSSLTMKMLHTGGVPVYADNFVTYESVLSGQPQNRLCLIDCLGKAVKLVQPRFALPPPDYFYNFIWLERDFNEQAKSLFKFLRLMLGVDTSGFSVEKNAACFRQQTPRLIATLAAYPSARLIVLRFEEILERPEQTAEQFRAFLSCDFDVDRASSVVVRRPTFCLPTVAELTWRC